MAGERLQKLLAAAGFGSRRGCEDFLRAGRVAVNGEVAGLGDRADPGRDIVTLDGEAIASERLRYWLVHKPRGMLTTVSDPEGRPTIVALVPPGEVRLFPVGRLDGETSGLVLMTNDGAMTHRLLHPSLGCEREYRVRVKGELTLDKRARLEAGVWVEGGRTAPARVESLSFRPQEGSDPVSDHPHRGSKATDSTLITEHRLPSARAGARADGAAGIGQASARWLSAAASYRDPRASRTRIAVEGQAAPEARSRLEVRPPAQSSRPIREIASVAPRPSAIKASEPATSPAVGGKVSTRQSSRSMDSTVKGVTIWP